MADETRIKRKVLILRRAEEDLRKGLKYLAPFAPQAAQRWADGFQDAIEELAINADRWGVAPETGLLGLEIRQLIYRAKSGSASRALFVIAGDQIRVLRIRRPGQPNLTSEDDLI